MTETIHGWGDYDFIKRIRLTFCGLDSTNASLEDRPARYVPQGLEVNCAECITKLAAREVSERLRGPNR